MDSFGLAEIVAVIPGWGEGYFLLGMRSLFLRSAWGVGYTGGGARSGSCTRGSARGGIASSSRSPAFEGEYLFLDLVGDGHLVARLAARDLGHGVLRLRGVVIIVPHLPQTI